jgi:hypothetical protein
VLTYDPKDVCARGYNGELGAISNLVAQTNENRTPGEGVRLSVVAGARNHLNLLLTVTDCALSRRKHRFDSGRERQ